MRSVLTGLGLQLLLLSASTGLSVPRLDQQTLSSFSKIKDFCPLAPKVSPPDSGLYSPLRFVEDESYKLRQVERLARAVQVPTTVSDHYSSPYDPGFEPFLDFHKVLESLFPLVYVEGELPVHVQFQN